MSTTQTELPEIEVESVTDGSRNSKPDHIGVEFEYPVAVGDTIPAAEGDCSDGLWNDYRLTDESRGDNWISDLDYAGAIGSDHTGAEIRSGIMDIQSEEPNVWYRESIRKSEESGYPFAATGYGETIFGLHQHISPIRKELTEEIAQMCSNEWARVFFCSSISRETLDPWRHGGVRSPESPWRGPRAGGIEEDRWEFRLPEPVLPDHFDLMMEFWRKLAAGGFPEARDFAREAVMSRDERLTPIVQYQQLAESEDRWPVELAFRDDMNTDRAVAEWFADLMGD